MTAGINLYNNPNSSGTSGGGGVTSLNGETGAVTIVAGSNITVTPSGANITIASTGGGSSAFSALTSSTNTTAAMVVGTGASLATSGAGTIAATSATVANGLNSATTTVSVSAATAPTNGQVLTATGGTTATWQTLPTGGIAWSNVPGTSQAAAVNNGYVANNASLVTVTLPATAAIGQIVEAQGNGAGGWLIAQNSGQNIKFGALTSTTGVSGSIASTGPTDSVKLICTTTNTGWAVNTYTGTLTVT